MNPRPFKLLVIDDCLADRRLLRRALEPHNIDVVTVESGIEGIEAAQHHRPDAVVLDWNMPGLDGGEILRVLRANHRTQRMLLIVLSGNDDPAFQRRALGLGADQVILKPTGIEELATAVIEACGL